MAQAQAAPSPVFGARMMRAPYVTDMAQTTAEVNWGTTISTAAGSVEWVDAGSTSCSSVSWGTWSSARSHASASTQVPYGASGTIGWGYSVGTTKEYQNSAKVPGLVADHTYCYAVYTGKTSGTDLLSVPAYQSFTTLSTPNPSSTSTVNFDVIGDTGENFMQTGTAADSAFPGYPTSNPYESKLYSQIGTDGSQFLLGAGDTSYNGGTQDTFGDLTHTGTAAQATGSGGTEYSNIFGPSYLPLTGGIPTYLADGNHGQNNYSLRFFPSQATAAASGGAYDMSSPVSVNGSTSESLPEDWYAFSEGNVRIYVLDAAWPDSNVGTGSMYSDDDAAHWQAASPEMSWLTKDLKSTPAGMTKFAVFHFPLQSDTTTENTDTFLDQDLEPVLAQNGVAMAFNGHAHTYQRFNPTGANTITSYVLGGGGGVPEPVVPNGNTSPASICTAVKASNQSVYAIGWNPGGTVGSQGTACGSAPTPTDVGQVYSYLHVQVTGSEITTWGVNADGGTFDLQHYGSVTPPTTTTTSTTSTTVGSTTTTTTGSGGSGSIKLATSAGASGATVTLPQAATNGELLIYGASQYTGSSNHISAVADNAGDKWTLIAAPDSTGHNSEGEFWYTYATGSVSTVTATTKATSIASEVQVFSGVTPGAVPASGSGSNTGLAASASTTAGGLEVGFVAGHGNAERITLGTGLTPQPQVSSAAGTSISTLTTGYETSGGSGTFSATFPTAMYWASGVAVFPAG
jgi:Calcineurin-like phosphoesterase